MSEEQGTELREAQAVAERIVATSRRLKEAREELRDRRDALGAQRGQAVAELAQAVADGEEPSRDDFVDVLVLDLQREVLDKAAEEVLSMALSQLHGGSPQGGRRSVLRVH